MASLDPGVAGNVGNVYPGCCCQLCIASSIRLSVLGAELSPASSENGAASSQWP